MRLVLSVSQVVKLFARESSHHQNQKLAGLTRRPFSVTKMAAATEETSGGNGGDRSKCVFCKIVDGKEANEIFYQDEEIVVFQDIKPASKHHLLVVTREHIKDSKSLLPKHLGLLDRLIETGDKVLLDNIRKEEQVPVASQRKSLEGIQVIRGFHWPPFHTVSHLHLHVIAPSDQMGFVARTIFKPGSFWFVTPEYVIERLEKMVVEEASKSSGN